jgi:hypothetical protein
MPKRQHCVKAFLSYLLSLCFPSSLASLPWVVAGIGVGAIFM